MHTQGQDGLRHTGFSRSHAPAWECIQYVRVSLFPCSRVGTRNGQRNVFSLVPTLPRGNAYTGSGRTPPSLVPTLPRGNAYTGSGRTPPYWFFSRSHAPAWEQETVSVMYSLVPTLLRGNAYTGSGRTPPYWFLSFPRSCVGMHTQGQDGLRHTGFSRSHAPAWERIHRVRTDSAISRSHAPAWECIHRVRTDSAILVFLSFPRSCVGTRNGQRNVFSRSHAPAWERIHRVRTDSAILVSLVPTLLRGNAYTGSGRTPPYSLVPTLSRSHASAWERIHRVRTDSAILVSLVPTLLRGNAYTGSGRTPPYWFLSFPRSCVGMHTQGQDGLRHTGFSRSHAPAWECIQYVRVSLFPCSRVGMHTQGQDGLRHTGFLSFPRSCVGTHTQGQDGLRHTGFSRSHAPAWECIHRVRTDSAILVSLVPTLLRGNAYTGSGRTPPYWFSLVPTLLRGNAYTGSGRTPPYWFSLVPTLLRGNAYTGSGRTPPYWFLSFPCSRVGTRDSLIAQADFWQMPSPQGI